MKLPSKKKKPQLEGAVIGDATKHSDVPEVKKQTDGLKVDSQTNVATSTVGSRSLNSKQKKVGLVLVLILVLFIFGLILLGRLVVVVKQPSQKVVLINRVCGDDIVDTYNQLSQYKQSDATGNSIRDDAGLNKLASEIVTKKNYMNDPTCQTILISLALNADNYNDAKKALDALKRLSNKNLYADSNLTTIGSLLTYERFVQQLDPTNKSGSDQEPQGGV